MSKVYQSVRGVVQGTLRPRKPHLLVSAPAKENDSGLSEALEEVEKIFLDGIGRLKTVVAQERASITNEAQHAARIIDDLRADISALEAKLNETERTVQEKQITSQRMEESLRTEIRELQSAVTSREEALASRESEVQDLKSNTGLLVQRVSTLESLIDQTKGEAAAEGQHAEEVIAELKAHIAELEARRKDTEDLVQQKEINSQQMEQTLNTTIRDLQMLVKSKEEGLASRESEIQDFKSKTDVLLEQITGLESAVEHTKKQAASDAQNSRQVIAGLNAQIITLQGQLRHTNQSVDQTETVSKGFEDRNTSALDLHARETQENGAKYSTAQAFVDVQPHGTSEVVEGQPKTAEENSTAGRFQRMGVQPVVTGAGRSVPHESVHHMVAQFSALQKKAIETNIRDDEPKTAGEQETSSQSPGEEVKPAVAEAARETVSQEIFDRITAEFSDRANVISTIASLIVRDHVRALGESIEKFPKTRLTRLLESLSTEIPDDKLKADFCDCLAAEL
jgi:soluble cytochrome b562